MLRRMSTLHSVASPLAEAIIREAPVALLVHDAASGACVLASDAVERLVGQGHAEIASTALRDEAWWKPPPVIEAMRTAMARGEDLTHLQEAVAPSGAVVVFAYRLRPMLHDGRMLLVTRMEDITHRGEDRDWRRAAERMEAIGRVAGDIAHEFGNLLTVILSYGTLLEMETPEDSPNRADLTEIVSAAEAAASLAQQFTALRRSQSRGRELVDIGELVERQAGFLARLASPQATVTVRIEGEALMATADRADVEYALVNAVLHAKDGMDAGGALTLAVRRRPGRNVCAGEVAIELMLPAPAAATHPLGDPLEFVHAGPAYAAQHGSGYSLAERVARESGGNFRVRRSASGEPVVEMAFPAALAASAPRGEARPAQPTE